MPWLDELEGGEAKPMGLSPQLAAPPETTVPAPPIGRLWDAALTRENTLSSLKEWARQEPMASFDAAFDPWRNVAGYEDHARAFIGANSEDDVARIKIRIDAERRREELLSSHPLGWVTAMAAGILDPINLVPVGGAYTIARSGAALSRIARVGRSAASVGVGAGVGQAVQEGILQATQLTRPWEESAIAIGAASALGGLRGGFR